VNGKLWNVNRSVTLLEAYRFPGKVIADGNGKKKDVSEQATQPEESGSWLKIRIFSGTKKQERRLPNSP